MNIFGMRRAEPRSLDVYGMKPVEPTPTYAHGDRHRPEFPSQDEPYSDGLTKREIRSRLECSEPEPGTTLGDQVAQAGADLGDRVEASRRDLDAMVERGRQAGTKPVSTASQKSIAQAWDDAVRAQRRAAC